MKQGTLLQLMQTQISENWKSLTGSSGYPPQKEQEKCTCTTDVYPFFLEIQGPVIMRLL